jgi:hypothetical protein
MHEGEQIYESKLNPAGGFQWSFKAPEAQLKSASGQVVGKQARPRRRDDVYAISLWSKCSLIRPCRTFCIEGFVLDHYQSLTLRLLPGGATLPGYDIFLLLDQAPFSRRTPPGRERI